MTRHALILLVLIFSLQAADAQRLSLKNAFPNLTFHQPLFLTHSGDSSNRLFVVRQDGRINVFPNDSSVSTAGTFLDISAKLSSASGEEGLLGLAFPPDFRMKRVFYVNYTAPSAQAQSGMKVVVARYTVSATDPNRADSTSEKILLEIEEPFHNHNGGMLAFGPDSMLYVGVGDGGSANDPLNNAQTLTTLLGKLLRLDVRGDSGYTIPPDNPFAGDMTGIRQEIWAYGFRNPWRFSFDTATGRLWVGDVGQSAREEIDLVIRGGNYGWNIMEGKICRPGGGICDTTGLSMPVADYGRDVAESITGGYVYNGSRLPQLRGAYIFGDYVTGNIFLLRYEAGKVTADSLLLRNPALNISSFGVDDHNELYVVAYADNGRILKITDTGVQNSAATSELPFASELQQNYPNPFNPLTIIRYTVGGTGDEGREARVTLVVYDLLGREVAVLVNEPEAPGQYEVRFDGSGLASGVYYYRLQAGSFTQMKAMMLVK